MLYMRRGRERTPSSVEMSRNANVEGRATQQKMTTYQRENCTLEDTQCQKCHRTEKCMYSHVQDKMQMEEPGDERTTQVAGKLEGRRGSELDFT